MVRSRKAKRPWNKDRDWATFYQESVQNLQIKNIMSYHSFRYENISTLSRAISILSAILLWNLRSRKTEIGRLFINSLSTTVKPCKCFNMNSRHCEHFFYLTSVKECSVISNLTRLMSKSTRIKIRMICGHYWRKCSYQRNLQSTKSTNKEYHVVSLIPLREYLNTF